MNNQKNSSNCSTYLLFVTTFFSHSSVMYMLSTYFFIKKDLMQSFYMTETELGIADGFRQVGSIIGSIWLLTVPVVRQKYVAYYFTNKILFSLMFLTIPFLQILDYRSKIAIYSINFCSGLFRSPLWALLLMILHTQKQKLEKNQSSNINFKLFIGIWTSSYDFGTIFGFFMSSYIVYSLKLDWTYCLYVGCIICIIMAIIFLLASHISQYKIQQSQEQAQNKKSQIVHLTVYDILKKFMVQPTNILFLFIFYLQQQIFFEVNMIIPIFLAQDGYLGYEGIIPAASNIFALLGILSFTGFEYFLHFLSPTLSNPKVMQLNNISMNENEDKNIQIYDETILAQLQEPEKPHSRFIFSTTLFTFLLCLVCLGTAIYSMTQQNYTQNRTQKNPIIIGLFICMIRFFLSGPQNINSSLTFMDVIQTVTQDLPIKNNKIGNQENFIQNNRNTQNGEHQQVKNNKSSALLGTIQIFSYIMLIIGTVVGSFFVQHYIRSYFFYIFGTSAVLLCCDFSRTLIIYRKNMQNDVQKQKVNQPHLQ